MFSFFAEGRRHASHDDALAQAARMFAEARRVLVITGAGMSADSGLPTYRGIGGLYTHGPTEEGIPIEDALSGPMFARDPGLTWKYIAQIEKACRDAQPNDGHRVLAELAHAYDRFCVLTQNVDGFHLQAGSRDVIEMHGDIHRMGCTACGHRFSVESYARFTELPPRCENCGGIVRPQVVLFGEMLPFKAMTRYERALADGFDLVVVIGTSAVFPYIAAPVREAWQGGFPTVEINPQPTDVSRFCHAAIRQNAAEALVALQQRLA